MKIVKITKVGYYYKLKLSDERIIKFHESIIIKYKWFRRNIEIDDSVLEAAIKDNEFYLALDKGISYLKRPRSKKELLLYLKKYYDKELVNQVVEKLVELNLIDDYKYAMYFIELCLKKAYGINKIKNTLILNGVSEIVIDKTLETYDDDIEILNCEKVFLKYLPNLKKESKKSAKEKVKKHLYNNGFSNDIITMVLEKNHEKMDNISDDELLFKHFNKMIKKYNIKNKNEKNKIIRSLLNKGFELSDILRLCEGGYEYD